MNTGDPGLCVLIVEDCDDDVVLLRRELKRAGFDLTWAQVQTAEDFKATLQSQPWDVVISDYKMPHFSAPAALDLLKQSGQDIPFIVVSGTVGEAAAVALMRAGACDYVMKDNLSRLGEAVRRELREAQDRRERLQAQADLERTRELLQLAIEGSGIGLWSWHIPSGGVWANERCIQLLGYDPATTDLDLTTIDTWRQRIHPDDYDRHQSLLQAHLAGLSPTFDCEIRLRHRQGHWIWVLDRGKVAEWDQADQPQRMSGTFTDITERKQAEEERHQAAAEILHNSLHDALTGLPNRTFLKQRLELAIQRSRRYAQAQFAVLFLDLDHFKVINDSLGHLAGDEILVSVAHTLKAMVRATDMAARLGGDEFVLLLEDLDSLQEVEVVAERLLGELQRPFLVQGRAMFLNASLGIVTSLAHYQDPTEPLRDADIAMYKAKARGRGCFVLFDPSMRQHVLDRLQLEQDLRQAIDQQELDLHYQPILRLATGQICGFEVLVRWHHPQRGLLLPADFIPMAEETGLIAPLDRWVLATGLQQLTTWQRHYPHLAHLALSFNVSPQALWGEDLMPHLQDLLAQTTLLPCCLNLEIAESTLIHDIQAIALRLQQLRDLGLSLTIDDFGTGHSSLSYLHQLPVSALKIDRAFVTTMETHRHSAKIVETLITLSNRLGLDAVAEGVETEAQNQRLRSLGCDLAQGYWFAHPLPAASAEQWLRAA
ncbi:MAG: EAL domain-containing protein [Leptolyngbya sp.]|nr:EAL domain-containing protein [Leptolyngbya sp.]